MNEQQLQFNKELPNIANKNITRSYEYKFILNKSMFDISATSGDGLDGLLKKLAQKADQFLVGTEPALVTPRAPPPCI